MNVFLIPSELEVQLCRKCIQGARKQWLARWRSGANHPSHVLSWNWNDHVETPFWIGSISDGHGHTEKRFDPFFSSTSRARNLKKFFDKSEEAPNPPKKTRGPKDPKEPPQEKDTKGDGSKKNKGPETDEPEKPKRRRKQWSVWIKDGLILINTGGSVLLHRLVFSNLGF